MNISAPLPVSALSKQHALTPQEQKLHKAAAEFESQLLSSLWKSMKNSFADDDDSEDPASQSLSDWGIDAMSGAVSLSGAHGEVQRLTSAVSQVPDVRTQRIAALQGKVRSGNFQPDSQKIADAVIAEQTARKFKA